MSQPEARLQRRIQDALRSRGAFVFKVHGSQHMMAGLPDLIVCYRGLFVGLEVKMPGGKTTARQDYVHGMIKGAGGVSAVVYSLQDAESVLDKIDKRLQG